MSKMRIGIAVFVLATLLSSSALARPRLGISPLGVARFAVTRVLSLGGLHHHGRTLARQGQIRRQERARQFHRLRLYEL